MQTIDKQWSVFKGAFTFNSPVPSNAESYDTIANKAGACVKDAVDKHGFHNFLGTVRSVVANAVEKAGNAREKSEKNGKETNESEDTFIQRLLASGALSKQELANLANAALAEAKCTFVDTLATAGTSRAAIGDAWMEAAERYISAWEAGVNPDTGAATSHEITLEKMRSIWPDAALTDPTNQEEVARLLREFDKRRREAGTL